MLESLQAAAERLGYEIIVILVNDKKVAYEEGLTVSKLLDNLKFVFPMLIVRINGELVAREAYEKTQVADNDKVEVIHLMSGG